MTPTEDEFAEFEMDEVAFDAMLTQAEPAEIIDRRPSLVVTVAHTDLATVTVRTRSSNFLSIATPVSLPTGRPVVQGSGKLAVHRVPTRGEPMAS